MEFTYLVHLSNDQYAIDPIFRFAAETFVKKSWLSLLGGRVLRSGLDGHCFAASQSND